MRLIYALRFTFVVLIPKSAQNLHLILLRAVLRYLTLIFEHQLWPANVSLVLHYPSSFPRTLVVLSTGAALPSENNEHYTY